MKKILFLLVLCFIPNLLIGAESVNLATMFQDKKDNEYAFSKKYENKELEFNAIVDSIDPKCYTKFLNWDGDTEYIPCVKLESPDAKIDFLGFEVPIASALMKDSDDLLNLKRGQKIKLVCTLNSEILWDMSSLTFDKCSIIK